MNAPVRPEVLDRIADLLARTGRPDADSRQILRLLDAVAELIDGNASSLDIKIASAALQEMEDAYEMFAPYRDARKVTIFGSARIESGNPIYDITVRTASSLADAGFMVVTGAGPGLMEAGMVGAGREKSIGVSIRLPFEASANQIIADDEKHVTMRYFFTRKLMLMKESHGFVCMPGGFGTLDETFELLTLVQTGRSVPAPIVFVEQPGRPFWTPIMAGLMPTLLAHGVISPEDTGLYRVASSPEEATRIIAGFYANFRSIRHVNDTLVIRMEREIPDADLDSLRKGFAHIHGNGMFEKSGPTSAEIRDGDDLTSHRVVLSYTGKGYAALLPLIDAVNRW